MVSAFLGAAFVAGPIFVSAELLGPAHVLEGGFVPASVEVADLDGDGRPDVVAAGYEDVCWWSNRGGDEPWPSECLVTGVAGGVASAQPVDLDGDGDLDVVASASPPVGMLWWEHQTDGWVQRALCAECDAAWHLAPADLDGDGDVDLAVVGAREGGAGDHWVGWVENLAGDGSAWSQHAVDPAVEWAFRVRAHDLDGDGRLDLVAASDSRGLTWWRQGDTGWTSHVVPGSSPTFDVAVVDVDGDGDDDLVAARGLGVAWWQNLDGAGSQWLGPLPVVGSPPGNWFFAVAAADLDLDHDPDLATPLPGSNLVGWVENDELAWCPHPAPDLVWRVNDLVARDLDRDGDLDLVMAEAFGDGRVLWFENLLPGPLFADGFESGDITAWSHARGREQPPREAVLPCQRRGL